jgi:hypothetical protein
VVVADIAAKHLRFAAEVALSHAKLLL